MTEKEREEEEEAGEELDGGLIGHISLHISTHMHTHIREDLWKVESSCDKIICLFDLVFNSRGRRCLCTHTYNINSTLWIGHVLGGFQRHIGVFCLFLCHQSVLPVFGEDFCG